MDDLNTRRSKLGNRLQELATRPGGARRLMRLCLLTQYRRGIAGPRVSSGDVGWSLAWLKYPASSN